jgi:hypothetical protein
MEGYADAGFEYMQNNGTTKKLSFKTPLFL